MSSIYVPADLKARLIRAARRRGFAVGRGRPSQLAAYLGYLVGLDEQTGPARPPRHTVAQALGLLAVPGQPPPTDAQVEALLAERRLRQ